MKQNKTVIGITGGVGSGKTLVLDYLKDKYGAFIIEADKVGHELISDNEKVKTGLVRIFGEEIMKEGVVDRAAVASLCFKDPEKLLRLNSLIHPEVRKEIEKRNADTKAPFVAIEAALLIECGYRDMLDSLWYIHVSERVREERLASSRGYSSEKFHEISGKQLTDAEFEEASDLVIENDGTVEELYKEIDRVMKGYLHGDI